MENMQEICDRLLWVLEATRGGADVVSLEYVEDSEIVIVLYANGFKKRVNVAYDSGVALIRDVMRNIN